MSENEYAVIYEEGPTSWGAYVPDLPGCIGIGNTFDEVRQSIETSIEIYVETLRKDGRPIPAPRSRVGTVKVAA
jgi:predicted RNase H-like HicB family nuclease